MDRGRIDWYSDAIGYGFIIPSDGGERAFVDRAGIAGKGRNGSLENGAQVTYEPSRGREGMEAHNVALDRDALAAREVREEIADASSVNELVELEEHEKRHENRAAVVEEYDRREREINAERIEKILLDRMRAKE